MVGKQPEHAEIDGINNGLVRSEFGLLESRCCGLSHDRCRLRRLVVGRVHGESVAGVSQGALMILWSSGCCMSISRQLHTMIGFTDRLARAISKAPSPMQPIFLVMKRHISAVLFK